MEFRPLGKTGIRVSPVALGCWPIAGIRSPGVNDADSLATIAACFDLGINFLDTAYCYGYDGESEKLIRQAVGDRRDEVVIATKGGIRLEPPDQEMVHDASPASLKAMCDESLQRLGTDRVELYYLHEPDPQVPMAESAGAIRDLMESGKVLAAGVSNVDLDQLREFHANCPVSAVQPPYNMLQREIEKDLVPWCLEHDVSLCVYWPLMKGLLAGKLTRDHQFPAEDSRLKYTMFQGKEWQKNMDFVDRLREIAVRSGHTVAQLVINWTIHQPGITAALCGAKRPWQIAETSGALGWQLSTEEIAAIEEAIRSRGTP
ncbi:MAG: aldo/keto reductase [Pirellulales bacterium]|nr:aldo/keto reductase [Pirellulales bacterium]